MMNMKFIKSVVLEVYTHEDDLSRRRVFLAGSTFELEEDSDFCEHRSCLILVGVGVIEVANTDWVQIESDSGRARPSDN